MKPVRQLPDGYALAAGFDLSGSRGLLVAINLAGLVLFFIFAGLFWQLSLLLRPDASPNFWLMDGLPGILALILLIGLVVVLHELVHGFFFWIFLQERPTFGFRGAYAYAAAPDWYLPRNQFLVVGLAPLLALSLVGVLGMILAPAAFLPSLIFSLTTNAAGSVGDLAVVLWLLGKPPTALINDQGDRFQVFVKE